MILNPMRVIFYAGCLLFVLTILSCANVEKKTEVLKGIDWSAKEVTIPKTDSLDYGKSYLSVYSQVYSYTEHTALDLTATVSIRNTSETEPIYLIKADYFDTKGNAIHSYVDQPIALDKMETLEIVIAEFDKKGGTGANFIFEWGKKKSTTTPLFEAVMISTYGQQGLSFTTQGKRIE
jgi:hypothetical protein